MFWINIQSSMQLSVLQKAKHCWSLLVQVSVLIQGSHVLVDKMDLGTNRLSSKKPDWNLKTQQIQCSSNDTLESFGLFTETTLTWPRVRSPTKVTPIYCNLVSKRMKITLFLQTTWTTTLQELAFNQIALHNFTEAYIIFNARIAVKSLKQTSTKSGSTNKY